MTQTCTHSWTKAGHRTIVRCPQCGTWRHQVPQSVSGCPAHTCPCPWQMQLIELQLPAYLATKLMALAAIQGRSVDDYLADMVEVAR